MNPNKEGWYYTVIKHLLALLRGKTSKRNGNEYCLHCPYSKKRKKF